MITKSSDRKSTKEKENPSQYCTKITTKASKIFDEDIYIGYRFIVNENFMIYLLRFCLNDRLGDFLFNLNIATFCLNI